MASFFSPYSHEFVRLGACVPHVAVADPRQNADNVLGLLALGDKARIALMVFPELGISAYAIDDLLLQDALLDQVERQFDRLISASRDLFPVFAVGAPLRQRGHLYNCGVVIHRGMLLGVVPKVYLPNYREFYERRQLTSGEDIIGQSIEIAGHEAPFGRDLLFAAQGNLAFTFHIEICEDLWVPHPPSTDAALAGAEILLNLSASNITIGKAEYAPPVVRVAIFPLHRRLCLLCGRRRRVDDRPRLGRPSRHLRIERSARRNRALLARTPRWRSPMSISAASARSGCARTPSATMRALRPTIRNASAPSRSSLPPPTNLSTCAGRSSASRMCRRTRRC